MHTCGKTKPMCTYTNLHAYRLEHTGCNHTQAQHAIHEDVGSVGDAPFPPSKLGLTHTHHLYRDINVIISVFTTKQDNCTFAQNDASSKQNKCYSLSNTHTHILKQTHTHGTHTERLLNTMVDRLCVFDHQIIIKHATVIVCSMAGVLVGLNAFRSAFYFDFISSNRWLSKSIKWFTFHLIALVHHTRLGFRICTTPTPNYVVPFSALRCNSTLQREYSQQTHIHTYLQKT